MNRMPPPAAASSTSSGSGGSRHKHRPPRANYFMADILDGGLSMSAGVVAAMIQAVKASGTIVRVVPQEFERLLHRQKEPLVVHALGGVFTTKHLYLMSYKGLAF